MTHDTIKALRRLVEATERALTLYPKPEPPVAEPDPTPVSGYEVREHKRVWSATGKEFTVRSHPVSPHKRKPGRKPR